MYVRFCPLLLIVCVPFVSVGFFPQPAVVPGFGPAVVGPAVVGPAVVGPAVGPAVVVGPDVGGAALSALRTDVYAAFLLPLPSNSRGLSLERHESLSRTPHTVMPMHRETAMHAWVRPWYWLVEELVTSSSVSATSTPSAAKLDSVVWKLLGSELPPVKWVCRPTQSIGTPRDLKSLIML